MKEIDLNLCSHHCFRPLTERKTPVYSCMHSRFIFILSWKLIHTEHYMIYNNGEPTGKENRQWSYGWTTSPHSNTNGMASQTS